MSSKTIKANDSEKIPLYVPVYNALYTKIMSGDYKDGMQLPSEAVLTKEFDVSRHTLRQALTILTEDGLIRKHQGKGSIVSKTKKQFDPLQKELFNPMIEYAVSEIDQIEINYNFAPPTDIASQQLGIENHEIILASNAVYSVKDEVFGHAFIQIPLKRFDHLKIDLNDKDSVSDLINQTIFKMASRASMAIKLVVAEDHITKFLKVKEKEPIILLEELLYTDEGDPICRCKFYFIPEKYEISIWI
ncbi:MULTISPECIES: GntR family transcriptional regulator [unclassified Fusibacter]|uniref:GntR family transcriptional regulator n=1 Tax=unclassified Fusibacter TaxID=2624464 RepID=UPI0010107558|nr:MULTISPECIES: GntR family transcriptional regulator [unclassified Fusibacter]MCK8059685.1 GntR family transcriptional regulator [Fusibacter sp. A2]NPE21486.1 GntR family transcriptional regulator [Fusibacter sp. A1]RXV61897.1 GntR family transcriptional regulator [Fusibacter sp. A1]